MPDKLPNGIPPQLVQEIMDAPGATVAVQDAIAFEKDFNNAMDPLLIAEQQVVDQYYYRQFALITIASSLVIPVSSVRRSSQTQPRQ